MNSIGVGTYASPELMGVSLDDRKALVARAESLGIDHLFVGDHIAFKNGFGTDGIVNAAALAAMSSSLNVIIGVYLLALRHPVPVARQLSSLSCSAPGRIVVGIGVGGEDPHEMEICGIDPSTRGRRTNHCLMAVRELLEGEPCSYDCEFFQFENALIKPPAEPSVPFIVGGRSTAAIRRAALLGDGWLGLWCSPTRFGDVARQIADIAGDAGRDAADFRHGLQVWVGFGERNKARATVAARMNDMYQMPFEPFEKYSPYGSPAEVAEFLAPYIENGCGLFNIAACGENFEHEIECVAELKSLLMSSLSTHT